MPRSSANSDFRDYAIYHLTDVFEHPINRQAAVVLPGVVRAVGTIIIDSPSVGLLQTALANQWVSTCNQFTRLMRKVSKDPKKWDTYDRWTYLSHSLVSGSRIGFKFATYY